MTAAFNLYCQAAFSIAIPSLGSSHKALVCRWFTPRGCTSKHYNPRMKNVMLQLAAVDLPAGPAALPPSSTPTQILVPEAGGRAGGPHADSASTRQPGVATAVPQAAAAVGWGLSVYSQAEEAWVMGEVLSWSSRQGQHHVLYEDGEDEWLKLPKEHVRWHSPSCTIAETAGLQKGKVCSLFACQASITSAFQPGCVSMAWFSTWV